ncbi:hypothetical protein CRUP_025722 [Coryphaenoides rupestris]|nr:hypothetical protein CRUP_025722 [Coryphaenoides rupestris]
MAASQDNHNNRKKRVAKSLSWWCPSKQALHLQQQQQQEHKLLLQYLAWHSHNCQLHRISFCADDKTDKRIFTFICKDSESNKHLYYVFDSEKCAFDLAYKKFLESGEKDVETRKQIGTLQKRIQELETENSEQKKQLLDLEDQLRTTYLQ